jgi:aspartate carbamoyltransferase
MAILRHLISINDLTPDEIKSLFFHANLLRGCEHLWDPLQKKPLAGKILACLFYEPSTRTSSSFIAAMARLGGTVIPITQGVQFSSVSKGETLEDTIRTLGQYADAIVLRHPVEGSAKSAAAVSPVPVINAGDGAGEHPTQALLDLFTMRDVKHDLEGKTIALVGDLLYGRTIHSLVRLLPREGAKLILVSPPELQLPIELRSFVPADTVEVHSLGDAIEHADIVYMTRVQKERFPSLEAYEHVKDACVLTRALMQRAKPDAAIMHPLPRVNEIEREIDDDPRAVYFTQVRNGMFVRMAILQRLIQQQ